MNQQQLKEWQSEHRYWNGRFLNPDGSIGPRTRWALAIDDLPAARRRIWNALLSCFGQSEPNGDNRSDWIDQRVLRAGGKLGDPWCAANVFCVLQDAGLAPLRTVSAVACLKQFPETSEPQPFDLGGWENPDGTGHVFFVAGEAIVDFAPGVGTYEGNHNNEFQFCLRPKEGLQFRSIDPLIPIYGAMLPSDAAPVARRSVSTTR